MVLLGFIKIIDAKLSLIFVKIVIRYDQIITINYLIIKKMN